jgi:hypothetical protein
MLVNVYKDRFGEHRYVEQQTETDIQLLNNKTIYTFIGQKEETLIMPKKKVMKYRWVYESGSCLLLGDNYYASREEFKEHNSKCVAIECIEKTSVLMDEDENSL